jgi:hypothetical protein
MTDIYCECYIRETTVQASDHSYRTAGELPPGEAKDGENGLVFNFIPEIGSKIRLSEA